MAVFRDADIPTLFADMGIPVTIGGVSGLGLYDEDDQVLVQDQNRGQVVLTVTTLTVQTSAFPTLAIDTAVIVNAKNYTVRERLKVGDAALTKLLLGST